MRWLLGWVLVAVLEWVAWRGRPHYGSGLPPRYYVPRLNLPPAAPVQAIALDGLPDVAREPGADVDGRGLRCAPRRSATGRLPSPQPVHPRPPTADLDPWLSGSLPVAPLERRLAEPSGGRLADGGRCRTGEPEVVLATWSTVIAARAQGRPPCVPLARSAGRAAASPAARQGRGAVRASKCPRGRRESGRCRAGGARPARA